MITKPIGIMTLHYVPNFGAVLQAYCLQEILKKLGANVEIIDYRQRNREKNFSIKELIKYTLAQHSLPYIIKFPIKAISSIKLYKFRKCLSSFYNNRLALSTRFNKENLPQTNNIYSAIIVGSDQVWNPNITDNDYSLLLDFYTGNKYSYSSSIGKVYLSKKESKIYHQLLKDFKYISCREQEGTALINTILSREICVTTLDPSLLVDKYFWHQFSSQCLSKENNFILCYTVKHDEELLEYIENYALSQKKKTVFIATPEVYRKSKKLKKLKAYYSMSPEEWVWYMRKADCIFTNSFHGIAFSINLEKELFISLSDVLDTNTTNSRLANIIAMFHLENRILNYAQLLSNVPPIDYEIIRCTLNKKRQLSLNYLKKILLDLEKD